jgi:conjugal transfer/entry exclusion protein
MARQAKWLEGLRALGTRRAGVSHLTRDEAQAELEKLDTIAETAMKVAGDADRLLDCYERRETAASEALDRAQSAVADARETHRQAQVAEVAAAKRLRDRIMELRS